MIISSELYKKYSLVQCTIYSIGVQFSNRVLILYYSVSNICRIIYLDKRFYYS